MLLNCLFVGLGGFAGSVCRYLFALMPLGGAHGFPIKTLLINVIGAFILSLIAALSLKNAALDPKLALMLKVGLCGGFTTFSTFAYEASDLFQSGQATAAVIYVLLSAVLGILSVMAAQLIVR